MKEQKYILVDKWSKHVNGVITDLYPYAPFITVYSRSPGGQLIATVMSFIPVDEGGSK